MTYSGATTGDILGPAAAGQPAQLDAVTPATRLVTITAGGNDVGFVPRLTLASLPWPVRALPRARARVAALGDPGGTDERFAQLARNLAMIARRLHERAPGCRVLAVDYLTILPPAGGDRGTPPPAGGRGLGTRGRRPARGHHAGGRGRRRLGLRRRLGGLGRPSRLVRGAVDAALPPQPARRGAVPSQPGRDGGGGRPGPRRPGRRPGRPGSLICPAGSLTA